VKEDIKDTTKDIFEFLDTNRDNLISPKDVRAVFRGLDSDNDRFIVAKELEQIFEPFMKRLCPGVRKRTFFALLDKNKNGKVLRGEFAGPFRQMDIYKDLSIDYEEMHGWFKEHICKKKDKVYRKKLPKRDPRLVFLSHQQNDTLNLQTFKPFYLKVMP